MSTTTTTTTTATGIRRHLLAVDGLAGADIWAQGGRLRACVPSQAQHQALLGLGWTGGAYWAAPMTAPRLA